MTACPLCRRPADKVHDACREDLDEKIAEMPRLYDLLETVLEPGIALGARVSGTRTPPLPARLEPLSLRAPGGMITILAAWENDQRRERGFTEAARVVNTTDLKKITRFLRTNLDWALANYTQIEGFAEAVHAITANCNAAAGLFSDLMHIGECPNIGDDGQTCGQALYADPHATPPITLVRCPACRAEWLREQWGILGQILHDNRKEHAA